MQIFKKIGQKMTEPLYFKGQIFQNPGQNPVFLPVFYPNLSSDGRPSKVYKIWTVDNQETNEHFLKPGKIALKHMSKWKKKER